MYVLYKPFKIAESGTTGDFIAGKHGFGLVGGGHMNARQKQNPPRSLRVTVVLATGMLLPMAPVSAEVLWRGDFETGTTEQWRGAPKTDSVKVVEDPVREGKYALRIDGTSAARRGKL